MRKSILFSVIYQFLFALVSLTLTSLFEGYRGEIFAGIFWFNVIYSVVGFITNASSVYVGEMIFRDFSALIIYQSIVVIAVVNGLFYFLDRSFVTLSLFVAHGEQFTVSVFTHSFIVVALVGSGLLYRRLGAMQQKS